MPIAPDPRLLAALVAICRRPAGGMPFVLGLCGAQGSGKSTLARTITAELKAEGVAAATLSLDDLYLPRTERRRLAAEVHPLLATRGVPGTHDIALGLSVLDALRRGEQVALPRFDKGSDDPRPRSDWPLAPADCRILIFEGWCVGARPEEPDALAEPVNALERTEDPDGRWRAYANACLAGPYQAMFARIDALALLAAPSFAVVAGWRAEQEADLAAADPKARPMNRRQIERFVQHYERITRHILAEMPARADLVARLDERRQIRPLMVGSAEVPPEMP